MRRTLRPTIRGGCQDVSKTLPDLYDVEAEGGGRLTTSCCFSRNAKYGPPLCRRCRSKKLLVSGYWRRTRYQGSAAGFQGFDKLEEGGTMHKPPAINTTKTLNLCHIDHNRRGHSNQMGRSRIERSVTTLRTERVRSVAETSVQVPSRDASHDFSIGEQLYAQAKRPEVA